MQEPDVCKKKQTSSNTAPKNPPPVLTPLIKNAGDPPRTKKKTDTLGNKRLKTAPPAYLRFRSLETTKKANKTGAPQNKNAQTERTEGTPSQNSLASQQSTI